jgi:hypothetical protein
MFEFSELNFVYFVAVSVGMGGRRPAFCYKKKGTRCFKCQYLGGSGREMESREPEQKITTTDEMAVKERPVKGGPSYPMTWTDKRKKMLIMILNHLYESLGESLFQLHLNYDWDTPDSDAMEDYMDMILQNVEANCKLFLTSLTIGDENNKEVLV